VQLEIVVEIVAIAVSFGVGVPILARGWARRDGPAILLALSIALDGLEWLFWVLCIRTPAYGTPLGDALAVACRIGVTASAFCLLLFTRVVFRPESRAAAAFLWLASLAMAAGFLGTGALGDWGGFRSDNGWIWLENLAQLAIYAWGCCEPLTYCQKLRRRVRLGLADPLVANRVLLWAVYGAGFAISQVLWVAVLAFCESLTALDALMVAATVVGEIAVWLAFFPPARYAQWVRSAGARGRPPASWPAPHP
jgi:hypothetical protein